MAKKTGRTNAARRRALARERGVAVYRRLMDYARGQGLDAKTVADRTGLRESQMSDWNLGKPRGAGPAYGELALIAEVLGRPLVEFLGDEAPEPTSLGRYAARASRIVTRLARDVHRFEVALRKLERGEPAGQAAEPRASDPLVRDPSPEPGAAPRRRGGHA